MRDLILDVETCSDLDLTKVGAHVYANHPSTKGLCISWAWADNQEEPKVALGPKVQLEPALYYPDGLVPLREVQDLVASPDTRVVAHNAEFELETFHLFGLPVIPLNRVACSMASCNAMAIPASLDGACGALGLAQEKDAAGKALMLRMCKRTTHTDGELRRLMAYCRQDVRAERALWAVVDRLSPTEQRFWESLVRANRLGVGFDVKSAAAITGMLTMEEDRLIEELNKRLGPDAPSPTAPAQIVSWLAAKGLHVDDIDSATVSGLLSQRIPDDVRFLLEVRQAISKASLAKIPTALVRASVDGRVHGEQVYHGASTGRMTSRGVQLHNLAKAQWGTEEERENAFTAASTFSLPLFDKVFGKPHTVFGGCIRSLFVPSNGKEFACADFAQIEARVLLWLANDPGLAAFADKKRDPYREMASHIYSKPADQIKKPSKERDAGKEAELGCGFGMGAGKFLDRCLARGLDIDAPLAERAVQGYRSLHPNVVALWAEAENAAIMAVKIPGTVLSAANDRVHYQLEGKILRCTLPSGRRLSYYDPEIKTRPTPWGAVKPCLTFMAVGQQSKKWGREDTYGGKLVENFVQAIARDLLRDGWLRAEEAGYTPVLSIHDELLNEVDQGRTTVRELEALMAVVPEWARGLPVAAEGWLGKRYRK